MLCHVAVVIRALPSARSSMIASQAAASIQGYLDYLRAGHAASGKPAFLVANRQGTGTDRAGHRLDTVQGFPVHRRCPFVSARARSACWTTATIKRESTSLLFQPPESVLTKWRTYLAGHGKL